MKKILFGFFLSFGIVGVLPLKADLHQVLSDELVSRKMEVASGKKEVQTNVIKIVTANDGSIMHIGVWSDGLIGTVIGNASNIGYQAMMTLDGYIIGSTMDYESHKDYFINRYGWGKIISYSYKQVIKNN